MTPFLATPIAPIGRHDFWEAFAGFFGRVTVLLRALMEEGLRSYAYAGSSRAIGNSPVVPTVGTRMVVIVRVDAPDCSAYFAAVFQEISPRTASFSSRFHVSPSIHGPSWLAPGALGLPAVHAQVQPLTGPVRVTRVSPSGSRSTSAPGWGRVWIWPVPIWSTRGRGAGMARAGAAGTARATVRAARVATTGRMGQG